MAGTSQPPIKCNKDTQIHVLRCCDRQCVECLPKAEQGQYKRYSGYFLIMSVRRYRRIKIRLSLLFPAMALHKAEINQTVHPDISHSQSNSSARDPRINYSTLRYLVTRQRTGRSGQIT